MPCRSPAACQVASAGEEGRQAGLAEAQVRISAAERQAGDAAKRADEQIAKAQSDAEERPMTIQLVMIKPTNTDNCLLTS